MADPSTDADLIERSRRGDDAAFGQLVDRYEGAVAATAIAMLGRGADAEDVGQETFVNFHRALAQFRGDSNLKTYLVRIAMNLSLNALKRRRRHALRFFSRDARDADLPDVAAPAGADDDAPERQAMVQRAIARLSPKHKPVVVLRMMQGLSTRETAEALGVPEGTVLSRLARAMKELEATLAPYVRHGAPVEER
jgi:RNA polymerase sigma-70 factor (ECF subfamily)